MYQRVAAVDVAKEFGKVCLRLPHPSKPGRRVSKVWDVKATTRAVVELGEYLVSQQVEKVTLESTSDYWRIFYYLLESCGLDVQLVNARDVKNVPGRPKTDKLDAVWLAKLTEKGLLRPSFIPPPEIRELRDYTRLRADLTRDRTRHWQRLESSSRTPWSRSRQWPARSPPCRCGTWCRPSSTGSATRGHWPAWPEAG
jgi:transposase